MPRTILILGACGASAALAARLAAELNNTTVVTVDGISSPDCIEQEPPLPAPHILPEPKEPKLKHSRTPTFNPARPPLKLPPNKGQAQHHMPPNRRKQHPPCRARGSARKR